MSLPKYKCKSCKAEGIKLWRDYNTFLEHQTLTCFLCTIESQNSKDFTLEEAARVCMEGGAIGWKVPAVPDIENKTYWGYTSVPQDRVDWWKSLPWKKDIKK